MIICAVFIVTRQCAYLVEVVGFDVIFHVTGGKRSAQKTVAVTSNTDYDLIEMFPQFLSYDKRSLGLKIISR